MFGNYSCHLWSKNLTDSTHTSFCREEKPCSWCTNFSKIFWLWNIKKKPGNLSVIFNLYENSLYVCSCKYCVYKSICYFDIFLSFSNELACVLRHFCSVFTQSYSVLVNTTSILLRDVDAFLYFSPLFYLISAW